jgi:lysozyme family protein
MTDDKLADRLVFTLHEEGGVSDDKLDPGGYTVDGITLATWRIFTGDPKQTAADLRAVTPTDKEALYGSMFWNPVRGDALGFGIDLMVFDHAVMAGVRRSAVILQRACGAEQDGRIGPLTLAAAGQVAPIALIPAIELLQKMYYRSLPGFIHDGVGWLARLERRTRAANLLAGAS